MTNGAGMAVGGKLSGPAFFGWAVQLFTNPRGLFRNMERSGGYLTPSVYLLGWGLASGVVSFLVGLLRPVPAGMGGRGVQAVGALLSPVGALVVAFGLVAVYLFVIWHWMGSRENYQTAFRVWAFMAPVGVVSAVLGIVPYLPLLAAVFVVYLIILASQEVHGLSAERSWAVWGALGGVLILFGLIAALAGDSFQRRRGGFPGAPAAFGSPRR